MTTRRLQAGERAILGELYPDLRRFAAVAGPLDVDPDDLLAEALAKTVRHHRLGGGDQQIDRLRRAILRAASGHRHRLGRERRALAQLHATGEGVEAIFTDVAELLRLSPTVRSLLFLVDVEDLDPSRVAAAVGTTPEAVVSTTDRARASLMERIGSTDGIVRAMDRLAQRGRTPSATAVMASAERRMTAPPRPAPPARGRLETTGWRKRRADFDRNVRSMAAGAAVAVFVVCAVVVGTVMLAARGGDDSTPTTAAFDGRVTSTTSPNLPDRTRIVGWSGIGELEAASLVAPTSAGFVASGSDVPLWSPDGSAWDPVEGPAAGAVVSVAGRTVVAIDPPSDEESALLWRSDDGGREWSPVAGSESALPDIPSVAVAIGTVRAASTEDVVIVVAELEAALDWASLLEVDAGRLSTGTVDERSVVWVEPDVDGEAREAYRLDAVRSGSDLTLRGVRLSDGDQVFQVRGDAGVLSTETATRVLTDGGVIGTAVWRSEDGERFERIDQLPVPLAGAELLGGSRFTLITDGSSDGPSIWDSQDGEDWEAVRDEPPFEEETLLGAARAEDDWVAVTAAEGGLSFWASIDGRHWFRADEGRLTGATDADISVSASGWVAAVRAADATSVYWSPNGGEWTIQIVPTRQLVSVVATRSGVLAVDTAGAVWFGDLDS